MMYCLYSILVIEYQTIQTPSTTASVATAFVACVLLPKTMYSVEAAAASTCGSTKNAINDDSASNYYYYFL